ncbi:MAG: type IV pilin [Haloarculaceae archaeon]
MHDRTRAVTPVIGAVLLVSLAVLASVAVSAAAFHVQPPDAPRHTALSLHVDAATDRVALVHEGGAPLDAGAVRLRVTVAGEPLAHQPPVPFFSARGFESGPHGPFNPAADQTWTAGETASFRLAATNAPRPDPGDVVRVEVSVDGATVANLTARG